MMVFYQHFHTLATLFKIMVMRKVFIMRFFTLLFVLLFSAGIFAQDKDLFTLGIKGGYTSAKFNMDSYDQRLWRLETDAKSGYLVGIYTRVRIFKPLAFQPEFYFIQKKGKIDFFAVNTDLPLPDSSFVTTAKSLDIPLLLYLRLIDLDFLKIFAIGGPVVSVNFDVASEPEVGFDYNESNWTILVGGGVEFWRMVLDARYEWSLSNIGSSNSGNEFYNMLTLNVGFKLFSL